MLLMVSELNLLKAVLATAVRQKYERDLIVMASHF